VKHGDSISLPFPTGKGEDVCSINGAGANNKYMVSTYSLPEQIASPQESNCWLYIGGFQASRRSFKRLVAVFEQMRDTRKAAAFLRAYQKAVPDDPWGTSKAEHFRALGVV
jgi:hypothetical protein